MKQAVFTARTGLIILIENVDYSVRESQRARNVTLKVSRWRGLEVVVPEGFDYQLLPAILSSRQNWIDSQLERYESLPGRFDENWPPEQLSLAATGITFKLDYREVSDNRINLRQCGSRLDNSQPSGADDESLVSLFVSWLKGYAKQHYAALAQELSRQTGLRYTKLVVRGQKTRWGSYSSRGTLSLNYKLLFLPEQLLRHVILHELSHSVHMNHSASFWHLLNQLDPDTPLHDKQLSRAWQYLPPWLD